MADGQLMNIGAVAGANIAHSLGKPELAGEIETAIKDEINAMSTHFTLAFADISTEHEIALRKLRAEFEGTRAFAREGYNFVTAHLAAALIAIGALLVAGFVAGRFA